MDVVLIDFLDRLQEPHIIKWFVFFQTASKKVEPTFLNLYHNCLTGSDLLVGFLILDLDQWKQSHCGE